MNRNLDARLSRLEEQSPGQKAFDLICLYFVGFDEPQQEAKSADLLGKRFERCPDETEQEFIGRLEAYARENKQDGIATAYMNPTSA